MNRSTIVAAGLVLTGCLVAWADRPIQRDGQPEVEEQEQPNVPGPTDLEWHILNFSGGSPTFIPERVLASRPLEELGFSSSGLSRITGLDRYAAPPGCQPRMGRSGRGAFASFSIEEAIASEPVAFAGTVKRIVPGLSTWELFVGRAVYVEIEEVIHGDISPIGREVAFVIPGGTILLEGKPICTDPEDGLHQPLVGDRLVVAGVPSGFDPFSFQEVLVLPVMANEVRPVDSPILGVDAQPVPYRRLVPDLSKEQRE